MLGHRGKCKLLNGAGACYRVAPPFHGFQKANVGCKKAKSKRQMSDAVQKANGTISSPEETGFAHSKLVSELKLDCLLGEKQLICAILSQQFFSTVFFKILPIYLRKGVTHGWIDKIAMDVGYRKGFRQQAEWWENGAEYKYQQNPHSLLQAPGPHTAHLRKYTNQSFDCSFRKTELQTSLCRLFRSFCIKICTIVLELKQYKYFWKIT